MDDINAGLTDLGVDSIKRFPRIQYLSESKVRFTHKKNVFVFDIVSKNLELKNNYPEDAGNVDIENSNFNTAYTIENNLFVSVKKNKFKLPMMKIKEL